MKEKKQKRPELIKAKKVETAILVTSPGLLEKVQKDKTLRKRGKTKIGDSKVAMNRHSQAKRMMQ